MTTLREAAQQALAHVQEFKRRWMAVPPFGNKVNKATREAVTLAHAPVLHLEEALRAALAQEEEGRMEFNVKETVCAKCGSTNGAHSHDCPVAKAALAQQEQATVKESLPVGQQEPEGGWQSAPSPQVTQRIADMPMSEYRRGVNDDRFKLGLREGRIKAEDEMREQPEQWPVAWWIPKAEQFCIKQPGERPFAKAWEPLFTHPPRREWQSLTEEEIGDVFQAARNAKLGSANDNSRHRLSVVEIARAIEQALKERNTCAHNPKPCGWLRHWTRCLDIAASMPMSAKPPPNCAGCTRWSPSTTNSCLPLKGIFVLANRWITTQCNPSTPTHPEWSGRG
jgi:hypothetical protein